MSINWRERFLRQQAESNVWSEINALQTQADEHLDEQRKEKINVGKNGAKTGYYRYNASTRNNYPACAKYNFVIVDTEGRKRCLTPLECSDLGFDYVTGTSQITPFSKNLGDSLYITFLRAEERFESDMYAKSSAYREQANQLRKQQDSNQSRKKLYDLYLQSKEWKQKRSEVLFRDGHCCQLCGDEENLRVHHLTYNRVGNEALFDLVTLCSHCHANEHGKEDEE